MSQRDKGFVDTFYKYTDLSGAQKILRNRTLLFSCPSRLNDPFDVYIDDLFGMDIEEVLDEAKAHFLDAIITDSERLAETFELDRDQVDQVVEKFKSASQEKRDAAWERIKKIPAGQIHPDMGKMRENLDAERQLVSESFARYGIFCATRTPRNLLMWAHYADQHQGCVIGMRPDIKADSTFSLLRPIQYSSDRPTFFPPPREWMATSPAKTSVQQAEEAMNRLLYTKSAEWSYEEELRLAIPNLIPADSRIYTLNYHPGELVELYLGVRVSDENGQQLIDLARQINPNVRVFKVGLVKGRFELNLMELE